MKGLDALSEGGRQMQFQNNFDLEEFLAYLLPGFTCIVLLYAKWSSNFVQFVPSLNKYGPEYLILFLSIVFCVALSLALGHLCSVFSRFVIRPLLYAVLFDPEKSIIPSRQRRGIEKSFYSPTITKKIAERFTRIFDLDLNDPGVQASVPRLIRAYVFSKTPASLIVRDRIVRARSLCSNLIPAISLAIILFYNSLGTVYCIVLAISAALLVIKQFSLDIRESKEIYTTFLSLDVPK
jgi:hypothetical protein